MINLSNFETFLMEYVDSVNIVFLLCHFLKTLWRLPLSCTLTCFYINNFIFCYFCSLCHYYYRCFFFVLNKQMKIIIIILPGWIIGIEIIITPLLLMLILFIFMIKNQYSLHLIFFYS